MSDRWRRWLITAVVIVWLGVQALLPLVRLVERGGSVRPRTFGWQMFSHTLVRPAERFSITTRNGTRQVDVDALLTGPMRREIVYAPAVIDALCERPEILAVTVDDAEYGTHTVTCR